MSPTVPPPDAFVEIAPDDALAKTGLAVTTVLGTVKFEQYRGVHCTDVTGNVLIAAIRAKGKWTQRTDSTIIRLLGLDAGDHFINGLKHAVDAERSIQPLDSILVEGDPANVRAYQNVIFVNGLTPPHRALVSGLREAEANGFADVVVVVSAFATDPQHLNSVSRSRELLFDITDAISQFCESEASAVRKIKLVHAN